MAKNKSKNKKSRVQIPLVTKDINTGNIGGDKSFREVMKRMGLGN